MMSLMEIENQNERDGPNKSLKKDFNFDKSKGMKVKSHTEAEDEEDAANKV